MKDATVIDWHTAKWIRFIVVDNDAEHYGLRIEYLGERLYDGRKALSKANLGFFPRDDDPEDKKWTAYDWKRYLEREWPLLFKRLVKETTKDRVRRKLERRRAR